MSKEYKYKGGWKKNTGTNPNLPDDTMVELYLKSGDCVFCHSVRGLRWNIRETVGDIIFYRIVSNEPITETQKQEAIEAERPAEQGITHIRIPLPLWNSAISVLSCLSGQLKEGEATKLSSLIASLIKESK